MIVIVEKNNFCQQIKLIQIIIQLHLLFHRNISKEENPLYEKMFSERQVNVIFRSILAHKQKRRLYSTNFGIMQKEIKKQ